MSEKTTAKAYDEQKVKELHSAAVDVAFLLGKYSGYGDYVYLSEVLEVGVFDSSDVTVTLPEVGEIVLKSSQFRNGMDVSRFRPGAWCDYLLGLARLAREVQAQAAEDAEKRAFEPIDDAFLFQNVKPELPRSEPAPEPEPTTAERLLSVIREIVQGELPASI